jgi:hypothetical protein
LTTYWSGSTDVFGVPASRLGSLNSLFQAALYLPFDSWRWSSRFRVDEGSSFRVEGLGVRARGSEFSVESFGLRVGGVRDNLDRRVQSSVSSVQA